MDNNKIEINKKENLFIRIRPDILPVTVYKIFINLFTPALYTDRQRQV